MVQLRLEETDLIMNKNPRMPICIGIDTSDAVLQDAVHLRNIRRGLERLAESITNSLSLRALADVCLISFGEKANITRPFAPLKEGETLEPEQMGGQLNLDAALEEMIRAYRIRLNDYEINHIKRYTPMFFLVSTDSRAEETSAAMSQINHWSRTGKITILPVMLGEQVGDRLSKLSLDGMVYQMNSMNYERLFDTFGKSIEMISRSSADTVESLKLKSIAWDEFRRK